MHSLGRTGKQNILQEVYGGAHIAYEDAGRDNEEAGSREERRSFFLNNM